MFLLSYVWSYVCTEPLLSPTKVYPVSQKGRGHLHLQEWWGINKAVPSIRSFLQAVPSTCTGLGLSPQEVYPAAQDQEMPFDLRGKRSGTANRAGKSLDYLSFFLCFLPQVQE